MSNIRAHSDPTHQHYGPSLPGHHLQNSYTQTGSFHVINETLLTNSAINSSLHHMVCSSAMDCESPVTSTTGLALSYHNSRFPAKAWAPIAPQNSLQSPPNSLQSPPLYHHSTHSSHHMRLNNVSHANGSAGSNSQHSSHHSRTGPVVAQQTFRQNRHVNHSSQHTPQHTSAIGSIGKSHQHLAHSAPSLQVAAISSSCPSASSTSSHNPSSTLVLDALTQSLHKSNSMTSPPSSGSSSDFSVPMDTSAGQLIPAFIQNTPTFQSLPPFQAPYQPSGQSLFMATNFQLKSNPIVTVSPKHSLFNQVTHPNMGSPAITSSTLNQQQRQTGLVESVLKRSRQSYASEEADRDDTSPMVHDLLLTGQHSIGRPQHWL